LHYLELSLLGPFEARLNGEPVRALTSEKMRALLAYLAVEADRPYPREQLAELLWPDKPPGIALQNLRQSLTRLQRLLPHPAALQPFLTITRHTVQFNVNSDVWLDTDAFEAARDFCQHHAHKRLDRCRDCAPQLETIAQLYRGEFLADLIAGSAAFEEWAVLKREWYRREALQALDHLAQRLEWQGRYEQAYQQAWRQVEIDPLREEAHAQVMRNLALSNRPREALLQYENLRQLLRTELNVEPAAETTALMGHIRDGALLQAATQLAAPVLAAHRTRGRARAAR
jgi:DNA-binding SARP family transcriptional activator